MIPTAAKTPPPPAPSPAATAAPAPGRRRNTRIRKKPAERRLELRDQMWPASEKLIWNRKEEVGFITIPRLFPLIQSLLAQLSKSGDPSTVYLDLWCRSFDEGFVEVKDEGEMAFSAGYEGKRAERTWRERMFSLVELGFIQVKPAANREFAYVLLLNPMSAIAKLRNKPRTQVPDDWWNAFVARAQDIGAFIEE